MNPDFLDMLRALSEEDVEFILVGAYALAAHGYPRATGDMDVWIRCSDANAARVWRALIRFGAPLVELTEEDLKTPGTVFQIGVPPRRIDILTSITAVDFESAWTDRVNVELSGIHVPVLSRAHLIQNKRSLPRPKERADVAWLEGQEP